VRELKTHFFGELFQDPAKAKLTVIRGEGMEGLAFHLKSEQHIVGVDPKVHLLISDDPFVSPRHANFFYRDGSLVVSDQDSRNGVYIRIRGAVPIELGDTFLAGDQLFRLEKVDAVSDDGPDNNGTSFYASPHGESGFRITQLFRGGRLGLTVHASGDSMVVGRDGTDVSFPEDLFMTGEHCRINNNNGSYTLTDLDSRNGTYVRIKQERELKHGDYVFIGRKLLRVEMNTN